MNVEHTITSDPAVGSTRLVRLGRRWFKVETLAVRPGRTIERPANLGAPSGTVTTPWPNAPAQRPPSKDV